MMSYPLDITVIGAGIGGLAAATFLAQSGHKVIVLEANSSLSEIGAGIQVTANAMRIFDRHGLKDVFYEEGTKNEGATVRRWDNGRVLGRHRGTPRELYGYFNLTLHRADYQRILYDASIAAGARVQFGKKVADVDFNTPSVTLEDRTELVSDLVVAADGMASFLLQFPFSFALYLQLAYQANIHQESAPASGHQCSQKHTHTPPPTLRTASSSPPPSYSPPPSSPQLVKTPSSTIWFGPHRHIVAYTIRGTSLYNLVFCGPEPETSISKSKLGLWNEPASLSDLKKQYEGWEETIIEILDRAGTETVHKWRIGVVPDLPSWRSGSGRVVLRGDAAHAMMPYSAQGATQSVEDAAVLAACLDRVRGKRDVGGLMEAYECIRRGRAEKVKGTSQGNMRLYGMVDGEEQEERDRMLAKTLIKKTGEGEGLIQRSEKDENAKYGSPEFSMWLYGYDVEEEIGKYFSADGVEG